MLLGLFKILGVLLFLYLTWRNLNDTYKEDLLISYSWLALLAMLVTGRLVFGIVNWGVWNENWMDWFLIWQKPGFSFFGSTIGVFGITLWYCEASGWKIWAFLEDILPIYFLVVAFFLVEEFLKTDFNWRNLMGIVALLISSLLGYLLKGRYRSWVWYRTGKKGFGFFFITTIFCWIMAVIGLIFNDGWMMVGGYGILGLISLVGLFILGEVLFVKGGKKNG